MKKKVRSTKSAVLRKSANWKFDNTEFMLLVAVAALGLLVFFAWQTGALPGLSSMVLGASTSR